MRHLGTLQRGRDRAAALAHRFVSGDLRFLAERHADVVQPLQQPPADLVVDLERAAVLVSEHDGQ
jgi:hypothetical protein